MKRNFMKTLSLILSLVLLIAMCGSAIAADTSVVDSSVDSTAELALPDLSDVISELITPPLNGS